MQLLMWDGTVKGFGRLVELAEVTLQSLWGLSDYGEGWKTGDEIISLLMGVLSGASLG